MKYMDALPKVFRDHSKAYKIAREFSTKTRDSYCYEVANYNMGFALGKKYVEDNVTPEAENIARDMVERLKDSFNDILSELDWMDNESLVAAKEKNHAIGLKLSYPSFVLNETELLRYYENFTFQSSKFFEAMATINIEESARVQKMLRHPIDKERWYLFPQDEGAVHDPFAPAILITAGLMQPPLFSKNYPQYLNYAGLGWGIGHEITHGFDNYGVKYNKEGNRITWMKNTSLIAFNQKAQCFVEQYNGYLMESVNLTVNGDRTLRENIADNGGVKESFKAYEKWQESRGTKEPKLPGLTNFTPEQLFFMHYGQTTCMKWKPGDLRAYIENPVHSPSRYRLMGVIDNSHEFSKAFECPADSSVNRRDKCAVW